MAEQSRWLRYAGGSRPVESPVTLTAFQTCVAGFIQFIELPSGDLMVINEELNRRASEFSHFYNSAASVIAGRAIVGDVVICNPSDVA